MDTRQRVRQFVLLNFYVGEADRLSDGASLLDRGVVDSTGVLEIIGFLESELGVEVADSEITPENLDSIDRITDYVGRKLSEQVRMTAAG